MGVEQPAIDRWDNQHGGGARRKRKQRFAVQHEAKAFANRLGTHVIEYPCRWHDEFERGETASEHWHVGRHTAAAVTASGSNGPPKPLPHRLGDHFPAELLRALAETKPPEKP